jgi:hypothetical protein
MELASKLHPEFIILDIHMDDEHSGAPAQLKSGFTVARLLAISIWTDDETRYFTKAIRADMLLDKSNPGIESIPTIRNCANHQNREQHLKRRAASAQD